ncbi:MAG TPA: flagellar export chaperone FliS [Acidimicrobiales bacterium]|nr:flagellar export chaperone FliS [Acidimicrobiales bacterium]
MSVGATDQDESLRRYLADQVRTATPAQRLVMLFDQLRRDLHCAAAAFEGGTLKEISDNLVHAQHVIIALRDPLDTETELGRALSGIYGFCLQHLVTANLTKDPSMLPDVQTIVDRLADANRAAVASLQVPASVG